MLSTAPPALQILVRSLRIDSPNTGTPPRWAIITHRREIHPKRALGISITANSFQLALMKW
jgi:hypothetical protein